MDTSAYKRVELNLGDGTSSVSIKSHSLEQVFDNTDRNLVLYSDVVYHHKDFKWSALLPTVKIPYNDPAIGFLLNGSQFSYR